MTARCRHFESGHTQTTAIQTRIDEDAPWGPEWDVHYCHGCDEYLSLGPAEMKDVPQAELALAERIARTQERRLRESVDLFNRPWTWA